MLVSALARALLGGDADLEPMVVRCAEMLGREWRWLRPLSRRYREAYINQVRPRHGEVVRFLLGDPGFRRAWAKHADKLRVDRWLTEPQQMQRVGVAQLWAVPEINGVAELGEWLGLSAGELGWFADLQGLQSAAKDQLRLTHYHYRVMMKRSGSVRLIESPKGRLKELQRKILGEILETIPAHPAAHGFIKGRSIKTFAVPHVGRRVVLRMDLKDFFPSISGARVQALFRTAGYPEAVADLRGGICTNVAPRGALSGAEKMTSDPELRETRELYARPHLPQGAPTSPALANLCSYPSRQQISGTRAVRWSRIYALRRRSGVFRRCGV